MNHPVREMALSLGFSDCGVAGIDLFDAGEKLNQWLAMGYHGGMGYMARHGSLRYRPEELLPEAKSIVVVRLNYLCQDPAWEVLNNPQLGFISRYAQNRDYHKLIRAKLVKLAEKLKSIYGDFAYRPTADSAPIMEKPLAVKAGLGWIGKHTNLINSQNGSYFFLGCLVTTLPLEQINFSSEFKSSHCGSCTKCITACPTGAIVAPYQLDARRCISYLTIEHHGSIPIEFRKLMGNRIYGCDDCQMVCPWNKFAKVTTEIGFESLRNLKSPKLLELFNWSEAEFLKKTEGSPIRRIGYERWMRNIAIALGNGEKTEQVKQILLNKLGFFKSQFPSEMVVESIEWALEEFMATELVFVEDRGLIVTPGEKKLSHKQKLDLYDPDLHGG